MYWIQRSGAHICETVHKRFFKSPFHPPQPASAATLSPFDQTQAPAPPRFPAKPIKQFPEISPKWTILSAIFITMRFTSSKTINCLEMRVWSFLYWSARLLQFLDFSKGWKIDVDVYSTHLEVLGDPSACCSIKVVYPYFQILREAFPRTPFQMFRWGQCTYLPIIPFKVCLRTHLCKFLDGHPLVLVVVKLFEDLVKVFLRLVLLPVSLHCHKSHDCYAMRWLLGAIWKFNPNFHLFSWMFLTTGSGTE